MGQKFSQAISPSLLSPLWVRRSPLGFRVYLTHVIVKTEKGKTSEKHIPQVILTEEVWNGSQVF